MALDRPTSWISRDEYELGVPDRAQVVELQSGIRYTFMARLKPNAFGLEATRRPAEFFKVEQLGGLAIVGFKIIDTAPATDRHTGGTIEDGFWLEVAQKWNNGGGIYADQAYFSFDTSGFDDGLARLYASEAQPVGAGIS